MNEELVKLQQKIDALNQRERLLLLVTTTVVVVMLLQIILIDPVNAERKKLSSKYKSVTSQLQQQENEARIINAEITAGINRNKIKEKKALQLELDALNKNIEESVVAMIPPQLMAQVLEQMLTKTADLKLLSMENLPVVSLIEQEETDHNNKTEDKKSDQESNQQVMPESQALYNHSFVLRLSGNYMSAIKYFESLAELPWRFYWDDLRYQVDSYPNAIITLKVHTVSMSQEWIGV